VGHPLDPEHAIKIRETWFSDGFECFKPDSVLTEMLDRAISQLEASAKAEDASREAEEERLTT
jgi:thioredoxin-like negative regulator of GroEL